MSPPWETIPAWLARLDQVLADIGLQTLMQACLLWLNDHKSDTHPQNSKTWEQTNVHKQNKTSSKINYEKNFLNKLNELGRRWVPEKDRIPLKEKKIRADPEMERDKPFKQNSKMWERQYRNIFISATDKDELMTFNLYRKLCVYVGGKTEKRVDQVNIYSQATTTKLWNMNTMKK